MMFSHQKKVRSLELWKMNFSFTALSNTLDPFDLEKEDLEMRLQMCQRRLNLED